jgi:5-methylcytosine-specific restriction endonuclease McrA
MKAVLEPKSSVNLRKDRSLSIRVRTSRGEKEVAEAHLRVGKTSGGKYKVYVVATNVGNGRLLWCEAGPGSTRNADLKREWVRFDIGSQAAPFEREQAHDYGRLMLQAAPLNETLALHSGLQENNPPELLERIDDDDTGAIDPQDERDLEGDAQTDIAATPPERRRLILEVLKRNAQRARRLKRERNYTCERCEEPTSWLTRAGEPYVEVHHLIPLGENGFDDEGNLVVLCSDCHRFFHHSHEGPETSRSIARERGIAIS